jgi:hypothetical protein
MHSFIKNEREAKRKKEQFRLIIAAVYIYFKVSFHPLF